VAHLEPRGQRLARPLEPAPMAYMPVVDRLTAASGRNGPTTEAAMLRAGVLCPERCPRPRMTLRPSPKTGSVSRAAERNTRDAPTTPLSGPADQRLARPLEPAPVGQHRPVSSPQLFGRRPAGSPVDRQGSA
jgi:hypothetical protein